MLLAYCNCLGIRGQQWMLLWPPLLTADEQFVESTSSGRIKLALLLFHPLTLNLGKALLPNPFLRD